MLGLDRRIVGRQVVNRADAVCVSCDQPFKFGKQDAPGVNVYSEAGAREIAISGMCEVCFDEATAEPEEEGDGDAESAF